jgi:hypothetical protein
MFLLNKLRYWGLGQFDYLIDSCLEWRAISHAASKTFLLPALAALNSPQMAWGSYMQPQLFAAKAQLHLLKALSQPHLFQRAYAGCFSIKSFSEL